MDRITSESGDSGLVVGEHDEDRVPAATVGIVENKLEQYLIDGNEQTVNKTSGGVANSIQSNGEPGGAEHTVYKRSPPASPRREDGIVDNIVAQDEKDKESKTNLIQVAKKRHILEKSVFVIAVTSLIVWAYGLFNIHWLLPYYYTVVAPILVVIRIVLYWNKKWQYFLLDFCYFANTICMVYIWVVPSHEGMFCIVFALANGPLLWAIPVYRNSLVFHSLDKMTSVFIHLLPAYLSFGLRWYPQSISQHWYKPFVQDHATGSFLWLVAIPLGCYIFHGLMYMVLVHHIIKPGEDYLDSYRHLTADEKSIFFKVTNVFGKKLQLYVFFFCSWVCCLVTMLFCRLWYEYFISHVILLSMVFVIMVWNGASFYMDVFAIRGYRSDPFSSV
ncbi:uncharacterized protein [Ptychodera flava]|uniref:uncharacterized protein n=1 Tax=Ptychodera flava TaxID=63121 RepID=UPI00396A542A